MTKKPTLQYAGKQKKSRISNPDVHEKHK